MNPPFDQDRFSNEYAHASKVEPPQHGPFDDSNRINSIDHSAALDTEDESDSSTSTPCGASGQGFVPIHAPHKWETERSERIAGQFSSELTTTTFDGNENTWQQWPEMLPNDPLEMDKEELLQLVASLNTQVRDQQLQLEQIRSIQRHELTNRPRGSLHGDLVNNTRSLRTQIFLWTSTHISRFEGSISAPKNMKQFRHIVNDPDAYINNEVHRSWLIQARLWDLLQYHIFDDDKNGDSKYYGYIWTGGRAKQTFLKRAVTQENERVDRDMRPLDAVLRPAGNSFSDNRF